MGTQQFLALFGESLFMDTVEAYLADLAQVGIVRIHPSVTDLTARLLSLQPDLMIVDLNAPHLHFVVPFLRNRPGVTILGLDLTRGQVIVLTSRSYPAPTAVHLLAVVERYITGDRKDHARSQLARATFFSEMKTF